MVGRTASPSRTSPAGPAPSRLRPSSATGRVELTPWNVALLRCATDCLEMKEEHIKDNLSARAEAYLLVRRNNGNGCRIRQGVPPPPPVLACCARRRPTLAALTAPTSCEDERGLIAFSFLI